ncbi:MAG: protein tyrosine phosphatase [Bacteroidetes bacterium CG23_combo_of_CG06-09_8_20_14_all_32_9]|nr:MAG: protein tyrosine phosphatase [Bacteroidetes bacterium CG23_combo_of_CG06-09_8_20_14_all_32_9]
MRILILCTGNSCRSQMAEGIIRKLNSKIEVFSAGTRPEKQVNKYAVKVMSEIGIDISQHYPKHVDDFISQSFNYVITVCDNAKEACPVFIGKVGKKVHIGFEDPADAKGTDEEIIAVYRKIRDLIKIKFTKFYNEEIC